MKSNISYRMFGYDIHNLLRSIDNLNDWELDILIQSRLEIIEAFKRLSEIVHRIENG